MTKKIIIALYTLIVVCIGLATIIEKYKGTPYVGEHIYGAWWFSLIWAVLTVAGVYYMVQQKLFKRLGVMVLHLSFVLILIGALITHLTSMEGNLSLRKGKSTQTFLDKDGTTRQLPFTLTLRNFRVINYPGTDAPMDFQSIVGIDAGGESRELSVSMNNIGSANGYRLFQSSYDSDGGGVTLGVYYDPWGIAVTYAGYLLLLLSIIWVLFSRHTKIRSLYREATSGVSTPVLVGIMLFGFLFSSSHSVSAQELQTVDKAIAHKVATINVLYNNRICPINTAATDFVTKLCGKSSWQGYSADEIFVSWMIYYSPWEQQKIIRIKSREVQRILGIDSQWASFSDFIDPYNEYKLKKPIEDMRLGREVADRKGLMEADEKYNVVAMFYQGEMLKMFPYDIKGKGISWFKPGGRALPKAIPLKEQFFIKQSMDFLTESIVTGQNQRAYEIIAKIKLFQRDMIGSRLPSENVTKAEIFYNTLNGTRWYVFLSLSLSLLMCIVTILRGTKNSVFDSRFSIFSKIFVLSLLAFLTIMLAMRWWVSGHVPISNGYETMQFMAWATLVITIVMQRRFPIILGLGTLIASFCLLVAMLAGGTPQITQLMPVLQSPLLSVHVMTVMCAYALFFFVMAGGLAGLITDSENYRRLNLLLLYPAVALLALGIVIGAVWANISWGNYWSWDPKEVWALITLIVYTLPLHPSLFRRPRAFHLYCLLAFLSVVITYFGVNLILGGMHAYN